MDSLNNSNFLAKENVLTVKEAALCLRLSESTVLRLAAKGILPGAKLGRQWRFSRESILDLIRHPERLQQEKLL